MCCSSSRSRGGGGLRGSRRGDEEGAGAHLKPTSSVNACGLMGRFQGFPMCPRSADSFLTMPLTSRGLTLKFGAYSEASVIPRVNLKSRNGSRRRHKQTNKLPLGVTHGFTLTSTTLTSTVKAHNSSNSAAYHPEQYILQFWSADGHADVPIERPCRACSQAAIVRDDIDHVALFPLRPWGLYANLGVHGMQEEVLRGVYAPPGASRIRWHAGQARDKDWHGRSKKLQQTAR
ncbi:hypothetical protein BAUCODRAFT_118822 [Baudoinia panamericana UAMH 10762]|uniref:Uncharacterized protein n=1 Tax=Baudoinia panamericana (strain UAMH 10762) TaxID=717646 RepID=M2NNM0_BAUPA|nr:uncharacterized protein BAUCODRAFT_118822 [Baudoinia panamericana UAMH 10762]EMD01110.1 hypothetical protein BAUCODRAFT_118822 [Baudoinia panamericana UAMH 10762]